MQLFVLYEHPCCIVKIEGTPIIQAYEAECSQQHAAAVTTWYGGGIKCPYKLKWCDNIPLYSLVLVFIKEFIVP